MKEMKLIILTLISLLTACVSQPVSLPTSSPNSNVTVNPSLAPNISPTAYPLPKNTDYNRKIVYISNFDNKYKITSVKSDGTQEQIVTYLEELPINLFLSLDGKKIYYITGDSLLNKTSLGISQFYSINIDGTDKKLLFKDNIIQSRINISRDRRKVLFIKNSNDNNLAIFDTETEKVNLLNVNAVHANFSPDNSKIVFTIEKKVKVSNNEDSISVYQLCIMNSDGTNIKQITNDNNSYINPQWTPDGSKIIVNYSNTEKQTRGIYSLNFDGTDLKQILNKTDNVVISPDGEKIAYNLGFSLYISNIDGSNSMKIIDKGFVSENGWASDSKHLLVKNEQLNVISVDGIYLKPISPKDIYIKDKINPELYIISMSVLNMSW